VRRVRAEAHAEAARHYLRPRRLRVCDVGCPFKPVCERATSDRLELSNGCGSSRSSVMRSTPSSLPRGGSASRDASGRTSESDASWAVHRVRCLPSPGVAASGRAARRVPVRDGVPRAHRPAGRGPDLRSAADRQGGGTPSQPRRRASCGRCTTLPPSKTRRRTKS